MVDDETLRMYIEESQEHLATIENDLLAIEAGGENIDEELVNKVFRAAHSLKGGAGFFNLVRIKELAHGIENVLGLMRSRELVPNPEVVNILLISFDRLRELINQVDGSNEADISDFLLSLKGLTTSYLETERKGTLDQTVEIRLSAGPPLFRITAFDLAQARKGGNYIYCLEYDLLHDIDLKAKTPLALIRQLTESGLIVDSRVELAVVGDLDDEPANRIPYLVLYASIIEPDLIAEVVELEAGRIHRLGDDNRLVPLAAQENEVAVSGKEREPEPVKPEPVKPEPVKSELPARAPAPDRKKSESPATVLPARAPGEGAGPAETSLRVQVHLLESLMNLAGELVLTRNQLLQAIGQQDPRAVQASGQKINLVTSELQEIIMLTRMQPIGNIFNKFQRVVRDLAQALDKDIALKISGNEVELDKTLIEGLGDPLTHLVRNAVDHGIELPEERRKAGKPPRGVVQLKAYHEAGQVHIEITDDGRGLDPEKIAAAAVAKNLITAEQERALSDREKRALIFAPGFSLAKEVTDISGRGVGMDVVKTNLDRLGGQVDIESEPGRQTSIHIKLPLTLAIIPCLFVSVNGERFAVPQVNVEELIYIPADQVKKRIELVGEREVLVLRGKLIPIVELRSLLGIPLTLFQPPDGERFPDQRHGVADRRSRKTSLWEGEGEDSALPGEIQTMEPDRRRGPDRRRSYRSDLNIVIVSQGSFEYGLVVEELHDSVEIVVKPLGRHLKHLREYAGATIMGDGRVAPILDINGLSALAGMTSLAGSNRAQELTEEERRERFQDAQALLLFRNHPEEPCAVPLEWVERVEQIPRSRIETLGRQKVMQYRGGSLPLFSLAEAVNLKELPLTEELIVIVFRSGGREAGLLAHLPVDAFEGKISLDRSTLKQKGIMGSAIIQEQTTLIVDMPEVIGVLFPEWAVTMKEGNEARGSGTTLLLAEDSDFFRAQVKKYLEGDGYQVLAGENGQRAWNLLEEAGEKVRLVVTDIEMPELDGYGLTRRIKGDQRFAHLPVVALTSLAGEEDIERGKAAGVDDYQIKLDKDKLLVSVRGFLASKNERESLSV